jgi:hypothetical protein
VVVCLTTSSKYQYVSSCRVFLCGFVRCPRNNKHALYTAAVQLYARRHCFMPPQRVTTYYERVVAQVRAEQQVST